MTKQRFFDRTSSEANQNRMKPSIREKRILPKTAFTTVNLSAWINAIAAVGTLTLAFVTYRTGESIKSVKVQMSRDLTVKEAELKLEIAKRESEISGRSLKLDDLDRQLRLAMLQNGQTQIQGNLAERALISSNKQIASERQKLALAKIEISSIVASGANIRVENSVIQSENRRLTEENQTKVQQYSRIVLSLAVESVFRVPDRIQIELRQNGEDFIDSTIDVRALVLQAFDRENTGIDNPTLPRVLATIQNNCSKVTSVTFRFGPRGSSENDTPRQTDSELAAAREFVVFSRSVNDRLSNRAKALAPNDKADVSPLAGANDFDSGSGPLAFSGQLKGELPVTRMAGLLFTEGFLEYLLPQDWSEVQRLRYRRLSKEISATRQRLKACVQQQLGIPSTADFAGDLNSPVVAGITF